MVVPARAVEVERRAGGPGERLEGVLHVLEGEGPRPLAPERQIDDGERAATDVDDRGRDGLVHRDARVAEPDDPGPVAERLGDGGAQDERDVLDRVVVVDVRDRRSPGSSRSRRP